MKKNIKNDLYWLKNEIYYLSENFFMKKKYTSTDIAKLAKVSQSTVSRALSPGNAWMISSEKRELILKLCRKYGYFPKSSEKKIYHKTFKVGFLLGDMWRDLCNTSFSLMLQELSYLLQLNSYTMSLIYVGITPHEITKDVKRILKSNIADIWPDHIAKGDLRTNTGTAPRCQFTTCQISAV